MDNNEEVKEKKEQNIDYKVIRKFSEYGPTFQKIMERILINKILNSLDK